MQPYVLILYFSLSSTTKTKSSYTCYYSTNNGILYTHAVRLYV
jgi:hypothetical protein